MSQKVVINLATGHEDAERVTIAFLTATAALAKGKQVTAFLTKEAVRLGLPGYADAVEVAGAPPVARLCEQFAEAGGEYYVCPICFNAKLLDQGTLIAGAEIQGTAPMWAWIGDDAAATFSY